MPNKKMEDTIINANTVKEFEDYLKSKGITNNDNLKTYTLGVRTILNLIKKDWNNVKNEDIIKAFATDKLKNTTKELYKQKLIKFYEFKKNKKLAKFIKSLSNNNILHKPTKTEDDILTKQELQKLIDCANNLRDKALIELYITTGARRSEICNLKIKDIKIEPAIIWVSINKSKSKIRKIPIVANKDIITSIYPENLVNYYNTHIFKNDLEKPLFYGRFLGNNIKPLYRDSINGILRKIVNKAKIQKKVTPHILRHTGATYDGYVLNEPLLTQKYGFNYQQIKTYCHVSDNNFAEHLLKLAGITEEQIKKDSICPQCKQQININDKRCKTCNYILDRTLLLKELQKAQEEQLKIPELKNKLTNKENENIKLLNLYTDTLTKLDDYGNRINNIETKLHISLNPKTPETQNTINYFKPILINFVEKLTSKKILEETIKKIDEQTNFVLNELNQKTNDELINAIEPKNLLSLTEQIIKKKTTR